ncbi:uncharacterized protein LOC9658046 [Selaginella moellendorffii]|uniref:uncharacterized protein LOC9658046 n=1 Tax=Selaginella moellendorffii TaxID=88036 RepID=UPI000D1C3FF8|nr:uncharacterized protein LOC9658046 [Selaginella moellendorffii]|eukprot:XP_002974384.2 uncharacterized protein LOC9658046 [Selaginella moellendorffii]
MPAPWKSWTKSLSCKSNRDEQVHSPISISAVSSSSTSKIKPFRSTCSRSLSNLKDVIHGNTKVVHKSASCSPAAISSHTNAKNDPLLDAKSLFWNPPSSELVSAANARLRHSQSTEGSRPPNLKHPSPALPKNTMSSSRRFGGGCHGCNVADEAFGAIISRDPSSRSSLCRYPYPSCQRCGESFAKFEALEQHHATKHAVTELGRGDSSKNIVEIIFRTSWLKKRDEGIPEASPKIERVLKVNNTHRTISRFEEYRDAVKSRASSLPKKHARCIADGNELLRFHAATLECSLGAHGSSSICASPACSACRIIKSGFRGSGGGGSMIHTTATSGRAHDSLQTKERLDLSDEDDLHAMLVCRVIAGRMHKGFGGDAVVPSGFDSIAGEMGPFSNVDDLYVTSSRAVLPCFVVVYRWK